MFMVQKFSLALCIALVAASPLAKRSTKTVTDDIADLGVKTADLSKALEGYTGGVFAAIPLQRAGTAVETSIQKAAADTVAEPTPISEDEAQKVIAAVQMIEPAIKSTTDQIVKKADTFRTLKGTVKSEMIRVKGSSDMLSSALIAKAPDSLKPAADAEKVKFDGYFDSAIKAVS